MDERNGFPASDSELMTGQTPSSSLGTAKEVMDRYNHCVLCGANLHFTHVTDFSRNLTQETARCPECGIKARHAVHRLQ